MRRGADEPIGDDELEGLFQDLAGRPLALAVSGGADSMALMHLVARWASRPEVKALWAEWWRGSLAQKPDARLFPEAIDDLGLKPPTWLGAVHDIDALQRAGGPPQVVVLTVDHGLRPEAADEAGLVAGEAERLGFPCAVLTWEGDKPRTGIQAAAREARRTLMLDVLRSEAAVLRAIGLRGAYRLAWDAADRVLVTAHHQEDQAETFLMRLARGSGIEGLASMRPLDFAVLEATQERPSAYTARMRRPLLGVPKARLVATLRSGGRPWIEDPSNSDERFERVRWRKFLEQSGVLGLTAEKIADSARRLGDAGATLNLLGRGAADRPRIDVMTGLAAEAAVSRLGPTAYARARTLRQLLRTYGGSAREPELAQLEGLGDLLGDERRRWACGGLTLGGCKLEFIGERHDRLRVFREGAGDNIAPVAADPGRSFDWDGGRFHIVVAPHVAAGARVEALGLARWARLKRDVPRLGEQRWPAAAAATLPVMVRDGGVVGHPAMAALIQQLAGGDEALATAWRSYNANGDEGVEVRFRAAAEW